MTDSIVPVYVAFDGNWEMEDRNWVYKDAKSQVILVEKNVTYEQLKAILYGELELDSSVYEIKLEVRYECPGTGCMPTVLTADKHVHAFITTSSRSVEKMIPLCVTPVKKVGTSGSRSVNKEPNVPQAHVTEDICLPCPIFVEANYAVDDRDQYDFEPYVNDDPVADSDFQPEEQCVNELPEADAPNLDKPREKTTNSQITMRNRQTPGTMSSHSGPSRSKSVDNIRLSETFISSDNPKWTAPMFTREDIEESFQKNHSVTGETLGDIHLGKFFMDKQEFKHKASVFAMKNKFEFMVKKSTPDLWYIRCKDPDCSWKMRGRKRLRSEMFEVTVFNNVHTCSQDVRDVDHRNATPWVVGHLVKRKLADKTNKYVANNAKADMKQYYVVEMSYEKAWRCREKAIEYVRGTTEMSYSKLPGYLRQLQKKNPDTLVDFVAEDGRFLYCFFSLGASSKGFKYCRPVICVDGTFLKNKYGGILLCAVAVDGNGQLFPLAFAVVDSENHNSWKYFARKLREAIGDVQNLAIISDRHASIAYALEIAFPEAYHDACYHHVCMNVVAKFKTDHCHPLIHRAAYAYRKTEFHQSFDQIKATGPAIAQYLQDIGFEKWSRVYFPGNRYDVMTSNYAESFNNKTKEARSWPVASLIEFIRFTLQDWFAIRRAAAGKAKSILTKHMEADLRQIGDKAIFLHVQALGEYEFLVFDADGECEVNLDRKTCSCGVFQAIGIPCVHVFAAAKKKGSSVYELCSPYYRTTAWRNTYREPIYPVGDEDEWEFDEDIDQCDIGVPIERNPVGRPKKHKAGRRKENRYPCSGEKVTVPRKCSRCGGVGHNKRSCNARL